MQEEFSEIIVVDNSQSPYMDHPIFVMLQEAFSVAGKELIFLRHPQRETVVYLKYLGVRRAQNDLCVVWDDDSIPFVNWSKIPDKMRKTSLLGFCFLDAVNYLGYSDWERKSDPDQLLDSGDLIHPSLALYHWFSDKKYKTLISPWGVGGLFVVNSKAWSGFVEREYSKLMRGKSSDFVSSEVLLNVAYIHSIIKEEFRQGTIFFEDRALNLYHPSQVREWDLELLESTISEIQKEYVKEREAFFVDERGENKRFFH